MLLIFYPSNRFLNGTEYPQPSWGTKAEFLTEQADHLLGLQFPRKSIRKYAPIIDNPKKNIILVDLYVLGMQKTKKKTLGLFVQSGASTPVVAVENVCHIYL